MAGPANLKLLTDFFNKIGHQATFGSVIHLLVGSRRYLYLSI
jgi:hypothetical protein